MHPMSAPPGNHESIVERHHPTLFFPDGDVVLSVKTGKAAQTLYRLDKSLLSRNSQVFRDLFKLPCDAGVNEEYEGVPVVRLDESDCPDAMEDLLKFMYNPASLLFPKCSSNTPVRGMKLLKVAEKYEIDAIKPFVVQQLERDWPTSVLEWQKQQGELDQLYKLFRAESPSLEDDCLDNHFPEPASAIQFALAHNVPSILPAAIYTLSKIPLECDWDRRRNEDEWDSYLYCEQEWENSIVLKWARTARWSLLDGRTLRAILLQRTALIKRLVRAPLDKIFLWDLDQCTRKACEAARLDLPYDTGEALKHEDMCGPLEKLTELLATTQRKHDICAFCANTIRERIEEEMEEIWTELPKCILTESEDRSQS